MGTYRAGRRFALVLSIALFSSLLAAPMARASGTAPWTLCTEQTYHTGECLGGSGSYGYQSLPAKLSSPSSLALSKSACPTGTSWARTGDYCSRLFTISVTDVDWSKVLEAGTEDVDPESETDVNAVMTIQLAPGTPSTSDQFCLGATTVTCTGTSVPVYAVEGNPPPSENWQFCVGGYEVGGGYFESCNSMMVTAGASSPPTTTTTAKSNTSLTVNVTGATIAVGQGARSYHRARKSDSCHRWSGAPHNSLARLQTFTAAGIEKGTNGHDTQRRFTTKRDNLHLLTLSSSIRGT
jgi:hypothetical protein